MASPLLMARSTLPGRTARQFSDARVVGVVHLDPADLEVAERVEEPVRRPLDVDEREVLVHHDELAVDVERVTGERHPDQADAEHREHLLDLACRLLVLAERQPGHRGRAVQEGEAPALEEPAAVDGAEDRHPEPGDHAAHVGLLAAPSHAGARAHRPHAAEDGAAGDDHPVVAGEHGLGIGRRAADVNDLDALARERLDEGVVLLLHHREVGRPVAPPVPLGLVVDQRLDGRIVPVRRHDPDLVARTVDEHRANRADVVLHAPPPPPHALLHRLVLEGGQVAGRDALEHLVVVLAAVLEGSWRSPREAIGSSAIT